MIEAKRSIAVRGFAAPMISERARSRASEDHLCARTEDRDHRAPRESCG